MSKCLTFIVPLRAPETCGSWEKVSALCNRTLASIANQSSSDWQCMLVCHRKPLGYTEHKSIIVVEEDFVIPKNHNERMKDKGAKKFRALRELDRLPSEYAMLVDADDLVCKDIVKYVSQVSCVGFVADNGYYYYEGDWPFLITKQEMHQHCGTSIILNVSNGKRFDAQRDIMRDRLMLPHGDVFGSFAGEGRPLDVLPFRSVVQCRGTLENNANRNGLFAGREIRIRQTLDLLRRSRFLTPQIRESFQLRPLREFSPLCDRL